MQLWIEDDYTAGEREVQDWIEEIAEPAQTTVLLYQDHIRMPLFHNIFLCEECQEIK